MVGVRRRRAGAVARGALLAGRESREWKKLTYNMGQLLEATTRRDRELSKTNPTVPRPLLKGGPGVSTACL